MSDTHNLAEEAAIPDGEFVVDGTRHVDASTCDLRYRPVHAPIVVER